MTDSAYNPGPLTPRLLMRFAALLTTCVAAARATPATVVGTGLDQAALVQWTAVASATDYVVEHKPSAGGTWTVFADGVSTRRGVTVTGLTNGSSHDFRISSVVGGISSAPSTTLTVVPGPAIPDPNVLRQILSSGQSLSVGAVGSPALSTSQPFNNLMLSTGNNALVPLVETATGASAGVESMSSALANQLRSLVGSEFRNVVTLHGVGGTAYSGLKKGTAAYSNGQAQQTSAFNLALAQGRPHLVQAVTIVHGETDEANGVTAAQYRDMLVEWQNDYQTDARALTGQTGTLPLFTCQMSSWMRYGRTRPNTALGQLMAAREFPGKIHLVAPKYLFDYSDQVHMKPYSYRRLGEYYGKVMKRVLVDRQPWMPLAPVSIVRGGKIITARFHVPVPPLQLDTIGVMASPNHGFEFIDSTSSARITRVRISGPDTLTIELDRVPTGANPTLGYALTGVLNTTAGRNIATAPKGNLRDSDSTPAFYQDTNVPATMGTTLPNWCMTFNDPIGISEVPPTLTAASVAAPGRIDLAWTAVPGATGYRVVRATSSGGAFATVAELGPAALSYSDTGLTDPAATLFYTVAALHPTGELYSNEACAAPAGRAPATAVWKGNLSSGIWDAVTANWTVAGSPAATTTGDAVVFNDTATGLQIRPAGTVHPGPVTFSNNSLAYSIIPGSAGSLAGPGSLVKSGSGALTLAPLADLVSLANCITTASSERVTVTSTAGIVPGMSVTATNGSLAPFTTVAAVEDATTLIISPAAAGTGSASTYYFARPNTYSGGTLLQSGTLTLGSVHANQSGLGSGPVTFQGGNLTMYSTGTSFTAGVLPNDLVAATTGTLLAAPRCTIAGRLSGSGTLNITLPFIRTDFTGDWSGFTGRVNATTTNATQGDFRLGHTYPMPGAAFNLGPKVHFMTTVIVPATGLDLSVGELAGNAGSFFKGGPTVTGPILTYTVGERNTDATFSGIITEQATGAITAIRKSGTGIWTLNAANTYKGKTTVAGGTLRLASPGSITNTSPTEVLAGGTLRMAGGTLSTASVLIQSGGTLTGPGTVAGTVTNHGTILGDAAGTPAFTGSIVNHGTIRLTGGASISATGTITNHGVFDKITGAAALPPRFTNLGVVLDSSLVRVKESRIEAGHFIATIASHAGHGYRLQRNNSLTGSGWQDVGPALTGTGALIQLSDPLDPARVSRFYRVKVDP